MTAEEPAPSRTALSGIIPGSPWFGDDVAGVQSIGARYLYQVATISALQSMDRPVRVLEIGSWIGASALTWAYAIDRFCPQGGSVLCIDPWKGYFNKEQVEAFEVYKRMHNLAESGSAYALFLHNVATGPGRVPIHHFRGTSRETLPYLTSASFDVVYVDGAHDHAGVSYDLSQGRRLVREGGIICGDDLELQLPDCNYPIDAAVASYDCVTLPGHIEPFHPGVTLAVHEAFGVVSCYEGFWIMRRTTQGFAPVDLIGAGTFVPPHLAGRVQI